jgi:predicted enzyme related to lactoylglutathione lyase
MNLGWLDVCLRVESVIRSREFYEGLGFQRAEGDDAEGWAVIVNGESRIGLFEPQFMGDQRMMLNFRGSDVLANAAALEAKGYEFVEPAQAGKEGGGSAKLIDPDGNHIFLDTAPGETKKVPG